MMSGVSPLRAAAFRAGVVAGVIMTLGMALMRAIEPTPVNFEMALGSLLTGSFEPLSWLVGFGMFLLVCGLTAVVYAAGFEAVRRFSAPVGALFGLVHWVIVGVAMGLVPAMYALVPELFGPPGFFGVGFGAFTVIGLLVLHLVFGTVVGRLYASARQRLVVPPAVPRVPEVEEEEPPLRRAA